MVLGYLADSHPQHAHNMGADALAAVVVSVFVVEAAVLVAPLVHRYCS
jgi:hypothetical protein